VSVNSFNPAGVWKPFGAFSQAVVQGSGKVVHLKGQVSLDREGNVVGSGDIAKQVEQSLENIRSILAAFGGKMEDIYCLTHHVTDIEAFMETGSIRNQYFKQPFPVTTTVEVSRLYNTELMVEITGSAEIPVSRYRKPQGSDTLDQ